MPNETALGVRPITDFIDLADIPLAEFLPLNGEAVLGSILVSNAWTELGENSFTLGAKFNLGGLSGLHLPGLDQFKLSFNSDSFATGEMVCGPEPSFELTDIEITLTIDPSILRARDGSGAKINTRCGLRLDLDGIHFLTFDETSLSGALVAGTDVEISLNGITIGDTSEDFLKVSSGELVLPMFGDTSGSPLILAGSQMAFGRDGPGGRFSKAGGSAVNVALYKFSCQLERAEIVLEHGQLTAMDLSGRLDLSRFLSAGRRDGWVAMNFSIGPDGVAAALSDDEPIIDMKIDGMFTLAVDTIRLNCIGTGAGGTVWLSGELTPDIAGVDGGWPALAFDEIGIDPEGGLRLAEGASIGTTQPFVLSWNFLKLTVNAFSIERPKGAPDDLELRLSAAVEILQGIPAGASVEGLVVRLKPDGSPDVRFNGIGIHFGTPGAYSVAVSVAWDSERKALSGSGHLDVEALDLRLDVIFASSTEVVNGAEVTTLFVAAESSLIPGGIPIASTGLSLYSVSGLLAHNLALNLPHTGPRRYFDAFMAPPQQGFAAPEKWHAAAGAHTIGLGVVIGTGDDGWMFSARGGLLLSIEDLTLLVTATADLLHERQPMSSTQEAKLAAVLAVHPTAGLVRLDFEAKWHSGDLFELDANGGGEFHMNRPLDFSVWLGKPPEVGAPASARALKLGGSWLLNADYWFGFEAARAVALGMHSQVELRAGSDSIFAELVARSETRASLSWKPEQLEGATALAGRARLVGGGLSLCLTVAASIAVMLARPRLVEIPLEACIEIDIGFDTLRLCLRHTFAWRDTVPPALEPLTQGLTLVPRHWTPCLVKGQGGDGIEGHVSDLGSSVIDLGVVQPHSELVLESSKSLLVKLAPGVPVKLNDVAVPLPQAIGEKSGWFTQWWLTRLALIDRTDTNREIELFGTFSRSPVAREDRGRTFSPRPPNTELRLLSSRRFGQDGSLGGGGVEESPSIDCTSRPTLRKRCVSLAGLMFGSGRLANGWAYQWRSSVSFFEDRDNRYGVALGGEDHFSIFPPEGVQAVELTVAQRQSGDGKPVQDTEQIDPRPVVFPIPVRFTDRHAVLLQLCWDELIAAGDSDTTSDWSGSSGDEEWTLAAVKRLLIPGHDYELTVGTEGHALRGTNSVGPPLITTRHYQFRAGRAPDWRDGLVRGVAAIYPADGVRPAFRDYDLLVRFHDDYFEALYILDQRRLGVRLRDINGNLVSGPDGQVLLPTRWETGPISRSPIERWWGATRPADPGHPCEVGTPPTADGPTILPIALKDLNLLPQMRYSAELIAVDRTGGVANPTEALASWSFTTSRFANFNDLADPPALVPPFGLVASSFPVNSDFDGLVRSFGAPAVASVIRTRITPVRKGDQITHLLIEAPEPLDDDYSRLLVTINSATATLVTNVDRTRIVAVLAPPYALGAPSSALAVTLTWRAVPGNAYEARRSVHGVSTDVVVPWLVPLQGVF